MGEVSKNFVFVFMLVLSITLMLCSSSWMVWWMMMEMSSFFFIPIIFGKWSSFTSVMALKYFFMQSVGSLMFFCYMLTRSMWMADLMGMDFYCVCVVAMMVKLGIFPFHGVLFQITENLSWVNLFLLFSIQEIIPIILFSKMVMGWESLIIISSFMIFHMYAMLWLSTMNISVRWMFLVSSLFNVSWMIIGAILSKISMVLFFVVYLSILWSVFFFFKENQFSGKMSSLFFSSNSEKEKSLGIFFIFCLMGFPPLGVFIGKMEVLVEVVNLNLWHMALLMVISSSMIMYMYVFLSLSLSFTKKFVFSSKGWEKWMSFLSLAFCVMWIF